MNINEIIDQMESGLEVALPGPWVFHPGTMRAIIAYVRELEARAEAAEAENLEQARLLGMGAERELALLSRAERAEAKVAIAKQALKIIAGKSQCIDNLMGNGDVAEAALAAMEATDE